MLNEALDCIIQNGDSWLGYTIFIDISLALFMVIFPFYVRKNEKMKNYFRKSKWLQPNMLSNYRMYLWPFLIALYEYSIFFHNILVWSIATAIFVILAMTDFWDGFIARILDLASDLGAVLDALADKWFILTILVALALNFVILEEKNIHYVFLTLTLTPIYFEYRGQKIRGLYDNNGGKAKIIGKIKTTIMFITSFFFIFNPFYIEIYNYFNMETIIYYCLIIINITSFLSMFQKTWFWNIGLKKALGI